MTPVPPNFISDGDTIWPRCKRTNCGLHVVSAGKVECWCDDDGGPLWELPGQVDIFGGEAA